MNIYAVVLGRERQKTGIFFSVLPIVICTELMDYILLITLTFCCCSVDISVSRSCIRTIVKWMSLSIKGCITIQYKYIQFINWKLFKLTNLCSLTAFSSNKIILVSGPTTVKPFTHILSDRLELNDSKEEKCKCTEGKEWYDNSKWLVHLPTFLSFLSPWTLLIYHGTLLCWA